ncbi:hypothetical protein Bca4012_051906 [Brassica carinata]
MQTRLQLVPSWFCSSGKAANPLQNLPVEGTFPEKSRERERERVEALACLSSPLCSFTYDPLSSLSVFALAALLSS